MIPVTKPFLPSREKLDHYIDGIYDRNWLTNNGPLVQELTKRLEHYLGVENLLLVTNGTLALQIAYRALGIHEPIDGKPSEAISTPFTFVATASSLKWEGIEPAFIDIDANSWNLNPNNIESAITPQTRVIVPVHVFGNPCNVEAIQKIADQYNLKVIYDAAHAFGVKYKNESILQWGDVATLSFHATKIFHTLEGGAIIFKRKEDLERAKKLINFGITGPECIEGLGINAKMSEFNAAMGLCVLNEMEENFDARAAVWHRYQQALSQILQLQVMPEGTDYNYAYFPVVFDSEQQALHAAAILKENGVLTRRYFYPSLESVEHFNSRAATPASKKVASRILCLPIFDKLTLQDQKDIINLIEQGLKK